MYYRWTEKARQLISSSECEMVGKWKRVRRADFVKQYPQHYAWLLEGYLEFKEETFSPAQMRNHHLWQLEGRTLSVFAQMQELIKGYKRMWPTDWNYYRSRTWQQMDAPTRLSYFLNKLRTEREANKKRDTCVPVVPDN